MSKQWQIQPSEASYRTKNPIRAIVDGLKINPPAGKDIISLSIGDPTTFGNFKTADSVNEAMIAAIRSFDFNGYPHSCGYLSARQAIATRFNHPDATITADDIVIGSGCSHAIHMAMDVLANPGQNILMPRPGFSLYQVVAEYRDIECKHYDLLPESSWEVDLKSLESLIDDKTAAIIVNNPSNPCGSVYSKDHLRAILAVAEKHCIPIIADEIYANMTFGEHKFFPMASLTTEVPILSVGGIAKQYLAPGWRVGWIIIHDRKERFGKAIRERLTALTQLILGCNSIVQGALPAILNETPQSFYDEVNTQLEKHARFTTEKVGVIPGLKIVEPQGAMYVMVGIDIAKFSDLKDDREFFERLANEQGIMVLPGSCFGAPMFFRIVITPPLEKLAVAYERLAEFCNKHLLEQYRA